ncbi:MAG: hypothetical protein K2N34_04800 [Lachnospiraceae bacterium]|nr:hypothetical protein [Lachnospiraceae bacterium]
MQKFKIFYSWQSDLPGNKTRHFIRECIDEAIYLAQESEAIEAEREEATTGITGSPDIVTTLFSKIDNCNLFIADLSLCYTEDWQNEKKSPNPNVLLELGYAVKVLGWERIICLCNTDYGDKYPFDIAHNRITDFSLDGKSKKEVKSDIAKIIFINIRDIRKQPPRVKAGMATHIIGTYDFDSHKVASSLIPIEISKQESYVLHNKELLEEAKQLVTEIQELTNRIKVAKEKKDQKPAEPPKQPMPSIKISSQVPETVHAIVETYELSETAVVWEDAEKDRSLIKKWIGIDVPDDFFDLGELKQMAQLLNIFGSTLNGTDDEKAKHEKLHMLSYKLLLLNFRTNYLKTFDGLCFVPLAIQNISSMQDTDISVLVNIEIGEIVEPDEHLIWGGYEGLQGNLCRDDEDEMDVGIICELFGLVEDGVIHIEDIPYNPSTYIPRTPILTNSGFQQPDKTAEDYKQELEEFIASTGGKGYYEFDVTNLRPNECRWLSCGMLLRPVDGEVKVHYQICSKYSMGDLSGMLEMKIS